jgi:hypothetical protein
MQLKSLFKKKNVLELEECPLSFSALLVLKCKRKGWNKRETLLFFFWKLAVNLLDSPSILLLHSEE